MTTHDPIKVARAKMAKARNVERNYRLHLYDGRNSESTEMWRVHLRADADAIAATLDRRVRGLLVAEDDLAARVSEGRDNGQNRPELKARLARVRAALRAA